MNIQFHAETLILLISVLFMTWLIAWRTDRREGFVLKSIICIVGSVAINFLLTALIERYVLTNPVLRAYSTWFFIGLYLSVFFLALISIWACFDCDIWGALYCANVGYCIHHIASRLESITAELFYAGYNTWLLTNLIRILMYIAMFMAYRAVVTKYRLTWKNLRLGRNLQVRMAFIIIISTIIYNTLEYSHAVKLLELTKQFGMGQNYAKSMQMFNYVMTSTVAFLALALNMNIRSRESLQSEKDALDRLHEEAKHQYKTEKKNAELLQIKYHDMKHQLNSLRGKVYPEYLDEIETLVNAYDTAFHTGNEALDVVLTQQSAYCNAHGITFSCLVNGDNYGFMPRHELYSLFNNIIGNAIEAAEQLPVEMRIISVTEKSVPGMLSICARNNYSGEPDFSDGLPRSSKHEEGHGYGLKSIRRIVENYGGGMTVRAENGLFTLNIWIPLS